MKIINMKDKNVSDISSLIPSYSSSYLDIEETTRDILSNIREFGDSKLKEYTALFDKVSLENFLVSKNEIEEAYKKIDPDFLDIVNESIENIREFHINQMPNDWEIEKGFDIRLGQLVRPIKRIGVYIPGGKAAYPSTVLMNCIPAQIAGVSEIALVSPPQSDGSINPYVLVSASVLGISEIYKIGGAQSIAALAYGTRSIKKVSKIVGPGNAFVASAKKMVFPLVDIDMIAGPSEVLIIADERSNIDYMAADIMAQGEHDEMASMYVVTTDSTLPEKLSKAIEKQLAKLDRVKILEKSLGNNLYVFIADSIQNCFEISNEIAPEHLEISLENPFDYLELVENAGSIFLGEYSPEALGDYFAGTNHTLPTNGTAKFSSPLGVYDFIKRPSYLHYSKEDLKLIYKKVSKFALYEGLSAHSNSMEVRFSESN